MNKAHSYRFEITMLLSVLVLSIARPAVAQYPRRSPTEARSRARQALLHSRSARRVQYESVPDGYRLRHERAANAGARLPVEPLPIGNYEDETIDQGFPQEGTFGSGGAYGNEIFNEGEYSDGEYRGDEYGGDEYGGDEYGGGEFGDWDPGWDQDVIGDDCGGCGEVGCTSCTAVGGFGNALGFGGPILNLRHTSAFAGVQGFRGPPNLGSTGSFGFNEGFNIGLPLAFFPNSGMGAQIGLRTLQSNLSAADFTSRQRNQTFFTVGAFRRAPVGFQFGLVVDMQRDRWYSRVDLTQLRGEVSWKFPEVHSWGYRFTASTNDETSSDPINDGQIDRWTATSLHAFFYRRRMNVVPGGIVELFTGFSGSKDGLIGTKAFLPLTNSVALQTDFAYLIPKQPTDVGGTLNEGWNLGLSIVWRLGSDAQNLGVSPYLPMFDVADNGSFMVDRRNSN